MRASPNGVPLSAADSSRPLSGLLAAATPLESLLVEMYVLRVEPTLLCGRQETLPGAQSQGYFGLDLADLSRRIFFCRFRLSARRMLSQSNS